MEKNELVKIWYTEEYNNETTVFIEKIPTLNNDVKYLEFDSELFKQVEFFLNENIENFNSKDIEKNQQKIIYYLLKVNSKKSFELLKEIFEIKIRQVNLWNKNYYNENKSLVDDYVFDINIKNLEQFENNIPFLSFLNSPTKNVGGGLSEEMFKKKKHNFRPMLSLKNAFNFNDIIHFDEQISQISKNYSYFVEPKIDGLSISLTYEKGKLVSAVTRGNGIEGEIVTDNILVIDSIPKTIEIEDKIDIRGEIYIDNETFEKANEQRMLQNEELIKNEKKPLELYANPRNLASGTLRQLDSRIVKQRNLKAFFFTAISNNGDVWKTQEETLKQLEKNNFMVNPLVKRVVGLKDLKNQIEKITNFRESLDYEIDGIVIKINEFDLHEKIGYTSKFPKWAIAYKFPAEVKHTVLKNIFPTIGRTGRVTYNAELEEVNLLGTKVKRATLHNSDYIKSLEINVLDEVNVKKAGDIIPKVIGVYKKHNFSKWEESKNCPSCGEKLVKFENEVDQYCMNLSCSSRNIEKLIHFTSRKAMNIEGLSKKQIEKFYNLNLILNIDDIYKLDKIKDKILLMDGYQEKSVNNILESIEKSKNVDLSQILFAFGIRHIGEKSSIDLVKKYKTIERIMELKYDELFDDYDFGEVKAKSLIDWISEQKNRELIEKLKELGVKFNSDNLDLVESSKSIFRNKKVLVTGSIDGATRQEVKKHFEKLGAIFKTSVTKDLDYIIVGKNGSNNKISKIDKNKVLFINNLKEIE